MPARPSARGLFDFMTALLQCTARHVLDKLKDAINFHIKRKRTAELKMEVR